MHNRERPNPALKYRVCGLKKFINRKHMWHATGINGSQGIFQSKRTAAEWLARGMG